MPIEFSCDTKTLGPKPCAAVAVGVFEDGQLGPSATDLDTRSGGRLRRLMAEGGFEGRSGQSLPLFHLPDIAVPRIILVGLGKEQDFTAGPYREAVTRAVRTANDLGAASLCCTLTELPVVAKTPEWNVGAAAEAAEATLYRFDRLKSKPATTHQTVKEIHFTAPALALERAARAVREGRGIAEGSRLMRDLANLPGNYCTPSYLADQARALGQHYGFKVEVLEEADMQKLGMGALLSVSRGSREPPKLITVSYQAGGAAAPVVLVGKGITFDSGGISIKPAGSMDEMKFDMSGAASVLGTLKAVAEIGLKINLIGVIPTCENMPDGNASKPGDVVTTLSGQTVEVLNTDAEGRLILCDALTYVERFKPAVVIDIATLTGACVIALGAHAAALLTSDDPLAEELLAAGAEAHDRAWRLPLWEDYQKQLDSNFADMANIGGREGGTITAACFLSRFTKKFRWAHLDIAGVAYRSGKDKGSTGRPVGLLTQFLIRRGAETGHP